MPITDLIPWKRSESNVPVRRKQEEDSLLDIRSQMNRLFDDFFERPFGLSPFSGGTSLMEDFAPRLDVSETDKDITISAELPGLEPEDINVALDHNTLTISGEKKTDKEEKGKRFYQVERSYGYFHRTIPLPGEVEEDNIDATFKRGILKVKVPKSKQALERRKTITINTN